MLSVQLRFYWSAWLDTARLGKQNYGHTTSQCFFTIDACFLFWKKNNFSPPIYFTLQSIVGKLIGRPHKEMCYCKGFTKIFMLTSFPKLASIWDRFCIWSKNVWKSVFVCWARIYIDSMRKVAVKRNQYPNEHFVDKIGSVVRDESPIF